MRPMSDYRLLTLGLAIVGLAVPVVLVEGVSGQQAGAPAAQAGPIDPLSVPRPVIQAVRIEGPIEIDGLLDDDAWSRAVVSDEQWIQTIPALGMPASEHTSIRVLYDDENLYVGAVLYESDPQNLAIPGLNQDYDTPNSDMFGVALDTYHDKQNGFVFAPNPGGALWDAQTFNDQRVIAPAWEGIVDVRTTVNDSSWIAEMAIPFATLRFNPVEGEQVWGINFFRRIRKNNEDAFWAPVPLQFRVYRFSLAGTLEGLRDLPRARNLWVKPYALGDYLSQAPTLSDETAGDLGLDVKWGLTPRLTLDLTANTDFSQVEVDQEQINLTRFSLFFPERRDFFLENEGTFGFQDTSIRNYRMGSNPRSFRLFNSRRIGLSNTREALPIAGGARLTGRVGDRFEVGLLDMQTRSTSGLASGGRYDAENFAVARVKAHLADGSTQIGGMLINREQTGGAGAGTYNRSYGIDSNISVAGNLNLAGYWARTDDSSPTGTDTDITMLQAAWRSTLWNVSTLFKHVGDGFNPRTGFVDRTSVRRYFGTVGVHPRVLTTGIREINPYVDFDAYTNLSGDLETRRVEFGTVFSLMAGGAVTLSVSDRLERLFEVTPIAGVPVATGSYEWIEPSVRVQTPGHLPVFVTGSVRWGDFYGGKRTSISGNLTLRPNQHFSLVAGAQHNDLELGGNSFTADLFSARLRYAHDTRTFFLAFLQYNESTEELITNVRFNLIHAPLSDVFLVFTERRTLADTALEGLLERGVTLKVTKLLAF